MNLFLLQQEFPKALFLFVFFTKSTVFLLLHFQIVPVFRQKPTDILKAKWSELFFLSN